MAGSALSGGGIGGEPNVSETAEDVAILVQIQFDYWKVYIHKSGRQLFSRRDAEMLVRYMKFSNPNGYTKVRIAELVKQVDPPQPSAPQSSQPQSPQSGGSRRAAQ